MNWPSDDDPEVPPPLIRSVALRRMFFALITLVGVLSFGFVWGVVCDPIGLGGDCYPWLPTEEFASNTLFNVSPPVWDDSQFLGLDRFTADEMNRLHPEIEEGFNETRYRYVSADLPSTGPLVVSVNPIDRFTWGAAVLSDRDDHCYLQVSIHETENPQYGETRWGVLPRGRACVASAATPSRVRSTEPVYIPMTWWPYIALGVAMFVAGLVGTVLARPFLRSAPVGSVPEGLIRFAVYVLAMVLVVMGISTFEVGLG